MDTDIWKYHLAYSTTFWRLTSHRIRRCGFKMAEAKLSLPRYVIAAWRIRRVELRFYLRTQTGVAIYVEVRPELFENSPTALDNYLSCLRALRDNPPGTTNPETVLAWIIAPLLKIIDGLELLYPPRLIGGGTAALSY